MHSRAATVDIGIGIASLSVVALAETICSCRALILRSSSSGKSIASLEQTHLTDVLKVGTTEGPHSSWSNFKQYFKILSTVNGKTAIEFALAQDSNRSNARTWAAIVRWAPDNITRLLSLLISPVDKDSLWSCSVRSLDAGPALRPMASSLLAHFDFSKFSWSKRGVFELLAGSVCFNFLPGGLGTCSNAFTESLSLWTSWDLYGTSVIAFWQRPNPNWKEVDSKNTFSAEQAKDQKVSNLEVSFKSSNITSSSKDPDHDDTFSVNSPADPRSMAATNARLLIGVWLMAWAKASSKNGNDKIFCVHLSNWAILALVWAEFTEQVRHQSLKNLLDLYIFIDLTNVCMITDPTLPDIWTSWWPIATWDPNAQLRRWTCSGQGYGWSAVTSGARVKIPLAGLNRWGMLQFTCCSAPTFFRAAPLHVERSGRGINSRTTGIVCDPQRPSRSILRALGLELWAETESNPHLLNHPKSPQNIQWSPVDLWLEQVLAEHSRLPLAHKNLPGSWPKSPLPLGGVAQWILLQGRSCQMLNLLPELHQDPKGSELGRLIEQVWHSKEHLPVLPSELPCTAAGSWMGSLPDHLQWEAWPLPQLLLPGHGLGSPELPWELWLDLSWRAVTRRSGGCWPHCCWPPLLRSVDQCLSRLQPRRSPSNEHGCWPAVRSATPDLETPHELIYHEPIAWCVTWWAQEHGWRPTRMAALNMCCKQHQVDLHHSWTWTPSDQHQDQRRPRRTLRPLCIRSGKEGSPRPRPHLRMSRHRSCLPPPKSKPPLSSLGTPWPRTWGWRLTPGGSTSNDPQGGSPGRSCPCLIYSPSSQGARPVGPRSSLSHRPMWDSLRPWEASGTAGTTCASADLQSLSPNHRMEHDHMMSSSPPWWP